MTCTGNFFWCQEEKYIFSVENIYRYVDIVWYRLETILTWKVWKINLKNYHCKYTDTSKSSFYLHTCEISTSMSLFFSDTRQVDFDFFGIQSE